MLVVTETRLAAAGRVAIGMETRGSAARDSNPVQSRLYPPLWRGRAATESRLEGGLCGDTPPPPASCVVSPRFANLDERSILTARVAEDLSYSG
jgi:hypothetical protein